MSNPNYRLHFETVIARLDEWRETIITELRVPATHETALARKRELDNAIACLEFCAHHQIRPNCSVVVLPSTLTRTPSSEYRIMEDHESENREYWTELKINEQEFRPAQGDIILSDTA